MRGCGMDGKMIRARRMLRQAERVQAAVRELALSHLEATRFAAAADDLVVSARKRLDRLEAPSETRPTR
jgi:hypothetical protein